MPAAIAFMRAQGSVRHLSSEFPLSRLHAGRTQVLDTMHTFFGKDARSVLASLYREDGYRFLLLSGARVRSDAGLVRLAEQARPVFRTPHSIRLTAYEYYDRAAQRAALSMPEEIVVYEIREILAANGVLSP
jgi:hypothetical protein